MSLIAQLLSLFDARNESPNRAKRSLVPLDSEARRAPPPRPTQAEVEVLLDEEEVWFQEAASARVFAGASTERVDLR